MLPSTICCELTLTFTRFLGTVFSARSAMRSARSAVLDGVDLRRGGRRRDEREEGAVSTAMCRRRIISIPSIDNGTAGRLEDE